MIGNFEDKFTEDIFHGNVSTTNTVLFLELSQITQTQFAKHIGMSLQTVNEIIKDKRNITPETAWLFAKSFGTSPEMWMNLQMNYDLTVRKPVDKLKTLQVLKLSAA